MTRKLRVGAFITSHGFGHGTRACAVLNEVIRLTGCELQVFSTLPNWFYSQNIFSQELKIHQVKTDIGLVQKSPFVHDLAKTIHELKNFLDFDCKDYNIIRKIVQGGSFDLIISDISPLGIKLADELNIPSVLIENFTWDWIYAKYCLSHPPFNEIIRKLQHIYETANLHIQAIPYSGEKSSTIKVPPISRSIHHDPHEIRNRLNICKSSKIVLLTTGGITKSLTLINKLTNYTDCTFIISNNQDKISRDQNIISMPLNSNYHYPDLVNASNLVVGKVGYGTLAECWSTHTPLLGCYRKDFRESKPLKIFADKNLSHKEISIDDFEKMNWMENAREIMLQEIKINYCSKTSGSIKAAQAIVGLIK